MVLRILTALPYNFPISAGDVFLLLLANGTDFILLADGASFLELA